MSVKPGPLIFGQYYHIFARGNNRETIFYEERNYDYFMALYTKYIEPVAETFAYCLLRNHFHMLVRIKDEVEQLQDLHLENPGSKPKGPSQQFSNLLNAYTKAVNKTYQRTGSLFQSRFGRKLVNSDSYFYAIVAYIHRNPEHHKMVDDFRDWNYSSYPALISTKPTRLKRDEVLNWYGSREEMIKASIVSADQESIQHLFVDD